MGVNILLEAGAIVHDADTSGATALHFAAGRGSAALIKSLLGFSADVDVKDERKETPLMWSRGIQVMELLVEARADVNARNVSGRTALMLASSNGDEDSIGFLGKLPGLDLDARDSSGCSAYAAAVTAGHHDAAELLKCLGAKADMKPASCMIRREEAFLEAARRGDEAACTDFLRDGVDLETE